MSDSEWYEIANADEVSSPALLVYPDRVEANIDLMVEIAGDAGKLRPHVKTHKLAEIIRIHAGEHKEADAIFTAPLEELSRARQGDDRVLR